MSNSVVPVGHSGFKERIEFISIFMHSCVCSENVAFIIEEFDPGASALHGWLNSNSHRNNIEDNHVFTGIGVAKGFEGGYYITQIFRKN